MPSENKYKVCQNEFCYALVENAGKRLQKSSPEIIWAVTEHNFSGDQKVACSSCKHFQYLKTTHTEQEREDTPCSYSHQTKLYQQKKVNPQYLRQEANHKSLVTDLKMTTVRERSSDTVQWAGTYCSNSEKLKIERAKKIEVNVIACWVSKLKHCFRYNDFWRLHYIQNYNKKWTNKMKRLLQNSFLCHI